MDKINVVFFKSDTEMYVIHYTDANMVNAVRTLGRWASNTSLSLSWTQAGVMADRMRDEERTDA